MSDPTPGWYPDPSDPAGRRYWDGSAWTPDAVSDWGASRWGATTPDASAAPAATTEWVEQRHGAYSPNTSALTGSRMRRVSALFGDVGRILTRAWWQILSVGLVLWGAWVAVLAILTTLTVDLTALARLVALTPNPYGYPDPGRAQNQAEQAEQALAHLLRVQSPGAWIGIAVLLALMTVLVSCGHIAAVSRLAMDAAAERSVRLADAWSAAIAGGLRLVGYVVAVAAIVALLAVGLIAAIAALWSAPGLAVLLALTSVVAAVAVGLWLIGRLSPIGAQVVIGPGALRWTWTATRGRFWAVLGRYLLWAIVASVLGQIVVSAVLLPLSVIAVGLVATPDGDSSTWLLVGYALTMPITLAVTALTYIGVVPIWRDLTVDPRYRAIGVDGQPL